MPRARSSVNAEIEWLIHAALGEALMARKNRLTGLTERKLPAGNADEAAAAAARPVEARLTTGAVVVELDPATIDRSFMPDRMETDDESYRSLRASIAAREHNDVWGVHAAAA